MKKNNLFIIPIALVIIIFTFSCSKSSSPTCGCNSATIHTIQSIDSFKGTLYYYNMNNNYSIIYGTPGVQKNFMICNTNFTQLRSLGSFNRDTTYWVNFSGEVKQYCIPDSIAGYINEPYNIILSNITKIQ